MSATRCGCGRAMAGRGRLDGGAGKDQWGVLAPDHYLKMCRRVSVGTTWHWASDKKISYYQLHMIHSRFKSLGSLTWLEDNPSWL